MNNKYKKVFDGIKLFFILLFCFCAPLWKIGEKLVDFALISSDIPSYAIGVCAFLCASIVSIIILTRKSFVQKMKTSVWLATHAKKIVLCYALPVMTLVAAKAKIDESISDLKDMVSASWTIFSLIITVFFVWQVLIPQYLRKKAPKIDSYLRCEAHKKMRDQTLFYERASIYFVSPVLVKITLAVLVIATAATYMETDGVTWFNLNITRCCFYYCLLTICLLVLDVLEPTQEDQDDILAKAKVSSKEIEEQAKREDDYKKAQEFIQLIDRIDDVPKSEKKRMKSAVCRHYLTEYNEE